MFSIISVYNNKAVLDRILASSLFSQTSRYEFIPIDNTQGQFDSAASALNFGAKQATGKYIMFVHQDVELDSPVWLETVESTLNTIEGLGIAGVAGMSEKGDSDRTRGRGYISSGGRIWEHANKVDKPTEVQTLDECVLIVPSAVFEQIQFDSATFDNWHCYGADYCLSVRGLGLKAYVVPAFIYHRSLKTNVDRLLTYQIRLFDKHKRLFPHIYTAMGEVSTALLAKRSLYSMLAPLYNWLFPTWIEYLKREIKATDTVLDLGCGCSSPLQYCDKSYSVGVELFAPYLEESRKKAIHSEYIEGDVKRIDFAPRSFDVVMATEVLEHLSKEDGAAMIAKMEKWARRKIIISTPNDYLVQDSYDDNPLQVHLSGWKYEDLKRMGFCVHGLNGWKKLRGCKGDLNYEPAFLWLRISHLTQWLAYFVPVIAFQLLGVKEVEQSRKT